MKAETEAVSLTYTLRNYSPHSRTRPTVLLRVLRVLWGRWWGNISCCAVRARRKGERGAGREERARGARKHNVRDRVGGGQALMGLGLNAVIWVHGATTHPEMDRMHRLAPGVARKASKGGEGKGP